MRRGSVESREDILELVSGHCLGKTRKKGHGSGLNECPRSSSREDNRRELERRSKYAKDRRTMARLTCRLD